VNNTLKKKTNFAGARYLLFGFLLTTTLVIPYYLQQSQAPKITRAAAINAHENPNEKVISQEDRERGYVEGEVLVRYDESQINLDNASIGQDLKLYVSTIGIDKERVIENENIRVYKDENTETLKETFESKDHVEYVEPNYVVELYNDQNEPLDPNDQRFEEQWGLDNDGLNGGLVGADIKAKQAWEITDKFDSKVVIGVIDTGVDYTHPELEDNIYINIKEFPESKFPGLDVNSDGVLTVQELKIWQTAPLKDFDGDGIINLKDIFFPLNNENKFRDGIDDDNNGYIDDFFGWDFYNNDNDPFDKNGHGTNISGVIAGKRNNGIGIAGINKDALIMGLKVFGSQGEMTTISPIVEAVSYANNNGIPITNSSLGMVLEKNKGPKSLEKGISEAATKGYMFFTAAGNGKRNSSGTLEGFDIDNSADTVFPAAYNIDNIIAVGASTDEDGLSPSSNYGAWSVDILAPGRSILTTKPEGGYGIYNGTSVATPHVAAVASFLWAYSTNYLDRDPNYKDIKKELIDNSDTISALSDKFVKDSNGKGAKRLNFYNIVKNELPDTVPVRPNGTPTQIQPTNTSTPVITITTNPTITPIVSKVPTGTSIVITKGNIDLVSNGRVGVEDFAYFVTLYQTGDPRIDYNNNGRYTRDFGDFVEFSKQYPKYAGK
jgi:subtilisin family serine protease